MVLQIKCACYTEVMKNNNNSGFATALIVAIVAIIVNEYDLNNVGAVQITEEYRTVETHTGNTVTRTPRRYELVSLIMKDGSNIPLRDEMAGPSIGFSGNLTGKDRQQIFSEAIASFIGVPFNRIVPGLSNPISNSLHNDNL